MARTSTRRCRACPRCATPCSISNAGYHGLDPEDVLITFGATEAIAAALLGLCDPGDEVVISSPTTTRTPRASPSPARRGGQ